MCEVTAMEKMTKRERDVMEIFWKDPDKSLSASEIMNMSDELSIYTIQQVIRNLLENNMIVVTDIVTNKKALTRMYKPTCTRAQYIESTIDNKTLSDLAVAFVNGSEDQDTLNQLKKMIQKRQDELKGR